MNIGCLDADILNHILFFVCADRTCAHIRILSESRTFSCTGSRIGMCALVHYFPCSHLTSNARLPLTCTLCRKHQQILCSAYTQLCGRMCRVGEVGIAERSPLWMFEDARAQLYLHGAEMELAHMIVFSAIAWRRDGYCCNGTGVRLTLQK